MKTKFDWVVYFTVLLIAVGCYCTFLGVIVAMGLEAWWLMWYCLPVATLIAIAAAAEDDIDMGSMDRLEETNEKV